VVSTGSDDAGAELADVQPAEASMGRMTVEQRAAVICRRRADAIMATRCELYRRPLPRG